MLSHAINQCNHPAKIKTTNNTKNKKALKQKAATKHMNERHTSALHHYHVRKRIHKKHEEYPHPDPWKRIMDRAIYPIGALGPLLTIPQLLTVWIHKDTSGLSLVTWVSWVVIAFFWLAYGITHREWPIIMTYIGWIAVELGVVIGILLY